MFMVVVVVVLRVVFMFALLCGCCHGCHCCLFLFMCLFVGGVTAADTFLLSLLSMGSHKGGDLVDQFPNCHRWSLCLFLACDVALFGKRNPHGMEGPKSTNEQGIELGK